ncbi:alpha/beta hydrolase fold [Cyclobacterium lianum]|uniref:Alpha/beta hydrolase fold n=1 Tax=Cyclobacterium lianum TaxID=388280 RepID=A0A1M7QH62_9BACT|nr:alpha/beta fold hydrolase [Cyclobacterium lianum]SHN30355.1 alpha/beta hydrolase fold [Cyclobacterium lianum]
MNQYFETIEFEALDGFKCDLRRLKSDSATKGPVLLVHGAGVSSNIFNPPSENNIIRQLASAGYDVWLENWRGSIHLEPNEWDLDQVARNDHPAAVQKIVEITGTKEIKAIIHCQGSTSFMISAVMGLLPEVNLIISNAVSLHPVVPLFSRFKLDVLMPVVSKFFTYLDPQWGLYPPDLKSKVILNFVRATHWEKDTRVGKMVSFTYGSGFPALWELENLDEKTKSWIQYEFAHVPLSFFRHIKECIHHGALKKLNDDGSDYVSEPPKTAARFVLFGGRKNKCFLPESQEKTFQYLDRFKPGFHSLYLLDGYSHLDVFFGKNAHVDVFPKMISELDKG